MDEATRAVLVSRCSGPQGARIQAVAEAARLGCVRTVISHGRCWSATRVRVCVDAGDVPALVAALRAVARGSGAREAAEWSGTADLLEAALCPQAVAS